MYSLCRNCSRHLHVRSRLLVHAQLWQRPQAFCAAWLKQRKARPGDEHGQRQRGLANWRWLLNQLYSTLLSNKGRYPARLLCIYSYIHSCCFWFMVNQSRMRRGSFYWPPKKNIKGLVHEWQRRNIRRKASWITERIHVLEPLGVAGEPMPDDGVELAGWVDSLMAKCFLARKAS